MTVKFIAHRGLSARFPENTHAAFRAAWAANCDGVELDIQVTKDGQVVVIHDPDTTRTSGEKYLIAETNYVDLAQINVGLGGSAAGKGGGVTFDECIPLLRDVITEMPSDKLIQIEIKQQIDNMDAVISELSDLRDDIAVQVISFDLDKLIRVRDALPSLDCVLVMDEQVPNIDDHIGFALEKGFVALDMDYHMATPDYVRAVLDAGLQVAHWTVNDADIAQRLIAQGANYIVSDVADELMSS